jgi:hypothetical protein
MTNLISSTADSFPLKIEFPLDAQSEPTRFLGLDINTNHTGFTVLDHSGRCIDCGVFNTENLSNVFEKAVFVGKRLSEVVSRLDADDDTVGDGNNNNTITAITDDDSITTGALVNIVNGKRTDGSPLKQRWAVVVEDFLRGFFGGTWQTQHLFTLAQMNSLICFEAWRLLGDVPLRIHVHTARAFFDIKRELKKEPIKDAVRRFALQKLDRFEWPRRSGEMLKWTYDVADSYLLAAYIFQRFQEAKKNGQSSIVFAKPPKTKTRRNRYLQIRTADHYSQQLAKETADDDDSGEIDRSLDGETTTATTKRKASGTRRKAKTAEKAAAAAIGIETNPKRTRHSSLFSMLPPPPPTSNSHTNSSSNSSTGATVLAPATTEPSITTARKRRTKKTE